MMHSTCDKEGFYLREFFIIKTNGVGMIIDAIDEEDALSQAGSNVFSIEESVESIERHRNIWPVCRESAPHEKNETKERFRKPKSSLEQQIDRLIAAVNQTKNISVWERRFAYGIKKQLAQKNKLSNLQMEKFNQLFIKIVG